MTPRRPLVRYHGGKWKLAPWILEHIPPHRVYVEPFGGGASVLLRKPRSFAEVYNDLDGEIVNLFRVVRDRGNELARLVALTPYAREEFEAAWQETTEPVERARRTLLRSHAGFGSSGIFCRTSTGFRSNSTRAGTLPAHNWRDMPEVISAVIDRMRGVTIEKRDAIEVMQIHDGPKTVHYVDPPYLPSTRTSHHTYREEMSEEEHAALAEALTKLRGTVLVSGYDSPLYGDLYGAWPRFERECFADGARPRTEVLWVRSTSEHADMFTSAIGTNT